MTKLAQDSLSYGTSIPESMKPVAQALLDQGKLLDANGDKITDLGQLNWEKDPLATGLDDLNKTLADLVDVLKEGLPQAAKDAAAGMQDAFNKNPLVIPVKFGSPGAPDISGDQRTTASTPPPQIGLQGGTHGQYLDLGHGHGRHAPRDGARHAGRGSGGRHRPADSDHRDLAAGRARGGA